MRHPSQLSEPDQARTLLSEFFERESADQSDSTRSRCRRVQQQLAHFVDQGDMSRSLDAHENAVLAAARRNGRGFLDAFGLEELVVCLPRFVEHDWLLEQTTDAQAQVVIAGKLISWLDEAGHLDHELLGCALHEAQAAVRAATEQPRPSPIVQQPTAETSASSPPALTLIRGGRSDR